MKVSNRGPLLPKDIVEGRARRIVEQYVAEYDLALAGLTVVTEAGSNAYRYTPLICALAGAKRVYALTKDSRWGTAREIGRDIDRLVREWGVGRVIEVTTDRDEVFFAQADILTNSGFVRPIDAEIVSWLKETCVIPLMWETWELRTWELDLAACKRKGVLVMGTDETSMEWLYPAFLALKLLFECQIEIHRCRLFFISSGRIADAHSRVLGSAGITHRWTSFGPSTEQREDANYIDPRNKEEILRYVSTADALICDERIFEEPIVGEHGIFTAEELRQCNETLVFLYRDGNIDYPALKKCGVFLYPDVAPQNKRASIYSYYLGCRPVIELNVAGLKVGEEMVRARLAGLAPEDAARRARERSLAQDFDGELAWIHD